MIHKRNLYWWPVFFHIRDVIFREKGCSKENQRQCCSWIMKESIFFEIHDNLSREGYGRDKYTRKAFRMLPKLNNPRILDVGGGPGAPTLELARLTTGQIIGVDTHQPYLDRLAEDAQRLGFSDRIKAINCSMLHMVFPDETFDVIWAEGSIYIIGFDRGLEEWRWLLKSNGFLAVHEMVWSRPNRPKEIYDYWKQNYPGIRTIGENLVELPKRRYELIGHFGLPEDAWWPEYYCPLEKRIQKLRAKYRDDPEALSELDLEQLEIEMFKKYHRWYGSAFFVMQKTE